MDKNVKMEKILKQIEKTSFSSIPLSEKIKAILQGGFIEKKESLFLKRLYKKSVADNFDSFPDKTGYECFVNHIHVEDYLSQEDKVSSTYVMAQTMIFIKYLRERLSEKYPKESFVIIAACDDESCHVRFHKKRHGESWVDDDLEQYNEAVMVETVGKCKT